MDYDRKKLKTMWGQFWAAHQVGWYLRCPPQYMELGLSDQDTPNTNTMLVYLSTTENQDTLFRPKGVQIREYSLYTCCTCI